MSWHVSPWIYPVWDSALPGLDYFLSHIREIFKYNLFKYFLSPFLFLFFFWDPYNSNVGVFNVVPVVSETVLNSFHYFSLFCSVVVISTILFSRALIRSSASVILLLVDRLLNFPLVRKGRKLMKIGRASCRERV